MQTILWSAYSLAQNENMQGSVANAPAHGAEITSAPRDTRILPRAGPYF